jgi:hypothetical protein
MPLFYPAAIPLRAERDPPCLVPAHTEKIAPNKKVKPALSLPVRERESTGSIDSASNS